MPTKPETTRRDADHDDAALLEVEQLNVHFAIQGNAVQRLVSRDVGSVKAVDGVSFSLRRGEVLGVVGESGSGKTTLGRALLGLTRPTSGSIRYGGQDLATASERQMRPLRRRIQMVFQDPHAALNPSMDLATAVGHPLRIHGETKPGEETRQRVRASLERVGLSPVERFLDKFPGDLSGGQKQRAVIARAIILGPELLVADEPVSMLDMSVRAKILELMLHLRRDLDLTYLYITHDLATAKFFCDRIAIMYLGRIVEIGDTADVFADPKHPYTKALLKAIPEPDPRRSVPRDLPRGEIPDAASPPLGCAFHPRCPAAFDACGWESRDLKTLIEEHWVRLDETAYDAERAVIGNLDDLDRPSHRAQLRPGGGAGVGDVSGLLERIRADDPDEPLWKGVREVAAGERTVRVDFHDGEDPMLRPADAVQVACHLYPEPDR